jgi:hypothetical protein
LRPARPVEQDCSGLPFRKPGGCKQLRSGGLCYRAKSIAPTFTPQRERAFGKALALIGELAKKTMEVLPSTDRHTPQVFAQLTESVRAGTPASRKE